MPQPGFGETRLHCASTVGYASSGRRIAGRMREPTMKLFVCVAMSAVAIVAAAVAPVQAAKLDPAVRKSVTKGLDWLVSQQKKQGYWEANGSQYRVAMTAL